MSKYRIVMQVEGLSPVMGEVVDSATRGPTGLTPDWSGTVTSIEPILTDAERAERAVGLLQELASGKTNDDSGVEYYVPDPKFIRHLAMERGIDLNG